MKFKRTLSYLAIAFCFGSLSTNVFGQIRDDKADKVPYYIDFNQSTEKIFEIQEGLLSLQYDDKFGKANKLSLKIYNWKRELVTTYSLNKVFGLNHFNIQLEKDLTLELGKVYACEATNEVGKHYQVFFRPIPSLEVEPPTIGILVNPVSFDCADPTANVVEFYGDIKNGKAPYTVSWYVLNNTRTAFIYQPKNETITRPGNTTIVRVDKSPDYYVMLLVKDACGAESRQMVHLTCGDKKKKINTVFVEPMNFLPGNRNGIK